MVQDDIYERFRSLREAFLNFDKDRSGSISPEELSVMAVVFGLDELHLTKVFKKCDLDRNGKLSFNEFCTALQKTAMPFGDEVHQQHQMSAVGAGDDRRTKDDRIYGNWQKFNSAVLTYDQGSTGFIHKKAMTVLLKMFALDGGSARYVLSRCDHHGHGKISYIEFSKALKKADYPLLNTPEIKAPAGALTSRHQEAMKCMSQRHSSTKHTTLDQRVAEGIERAHSKTVLPGSGSRASMLPPGTGASGRSGRPEPIQTSRSHRSQASQSTSPLLSPGLRSPGSHHLGCERSPSQLQSTRGRDSKLSKSTSPSTRRSSQRSPGTHVSLSPQVAQVEAALAREMFEAFRGLSKAFQSADEDQSGYLEPREVWKLCTRFKLNRPAVQDVIRHMDKDGDGRLSHEEFVDTLRDATRCPGLYAAVPRVENIDRRPGANRQYQSDPQPQSVAKQSQSPQRSPQPPGSGRSEGSGRSPKSDDFMLESFRASRKHHSKATDELAELPEEEEAQYEEDNMLSQLTPPKLRTMHFTQKSASQLSTRTCPA